MTYIIRVSSVCRNPGQLADILSRYSSPVDTGMVLVQSSDVTGSGGRTRQSGVFFTRVHFDIFGLFFPRDVHDLDSAIKLLVDVYGAENLTLCVTESESSSPSSSLYSHCGGSLGSGEQSTEVYEQELTTLRRFSN